MANPTLPDRLRELRSEKGVSQSEAADAIGMSRSYLAGCETGADTPGRELLIAMAGYYDVSLDWLSTGEGEKRLARPRSLEEHRLLEAYRRLPPEEATMYLTLMRARAEGAAVVGEEGEAGRAAKGGR